ncbi:hypothetical protein NLG97_g5338 [Lecanicillium saksenae]|uniref:Uncharacterized protein n=1 Tax=Lecanicillium saksenae TaxID=468837 RepID=A0ACC1QUH0_9HYPO|nr:hypothetical protein NLG97_g5338 [Lecanicillium saksenae]
MSAPPAAAIITQSSEPEKAVSSTPDRPVPRQRRSDAHRAQVRTQNRRRAYLQHHPKYFDNIEHELADPILYERLVKRHQSAAEREAEGRAKGYGRTLEADLVRGETKLSNLRDAAGTSASNFLPGSLAGGGGDIDETWADDQPAESKAHGLELWNKYLAHRFVQGRDEEFDYAAVDGNDEYDDVARMEAQDEWFDEEEPGRADDSAPLQGETGVQDF